MRDKEFDDILRNKFESFEASDAARSWDLLNERLESENSYAQFDDEIRDVLSGFVAAGQPDWDAMQAKLYAAVGFSDAFDDRMRHALVGFASTTQPDWAAFEERLDEEFDRDIKKRVENYSTVHDASTWPVLDEKFRESETLRRRLIVAKILEVAAVLIALATFSNVFPELQSTIQENRTVITQGAQNEAAELSVVETAQTATDVQFLEKEQKEALQATDVLSNTNDGGTQGIASASEINVARSNEVLNTSPIVSRHGAVVDRGRAIEVAELVEEINIWEGVSAEPNSQDVSKLDAPELTYREKDVGPKTYEQLGLLAGIEPAGVSANLGLGLPSVGAIQLGNVLKVSIGGSYDLNALYIPADRFYANGYPINFSEKNLLASGYSAGASLLWNYGVWSFETGLYYSSKSYKPNRILQIGQTFDLRILDFQKIDLHIVNVPLQAHWNFDRKGKTRFYAVGGASFNLIAAAHYDLNARNSFRSPLAGSGSAKNKTDLEIARVREHILDGAEFSAKSFITINAGFGVEHQLPGRFSVFTQPTYNYQVPFFHISDPNGKHLQYLSVQFGTRIRIK